MVPATIWFLLLSAVACGGRSADRTENTLGLCSDGRDNDGDGNIDCVDQDCWVFVICSSEDGGPDSDTDTDTDTDSDTDSDGDSDTNTDTGSSTDTGTDTDTGFVCGDDCWGADGCLTDAGRCVRFTCRPNDEGGDFCGDCMGWSEITYDHWMNDGVCRDVGAKYHAVAGNTSRCGFDGAHCCGTADDCSGGDNPWHFSKDGVIYVVGPVLIVDDLDCSAGLDYDPIAVGERAGYTRLTACERL